MAVETSVFSGTEVKLNINIEPIGEIHMEQMDFVVDAYTFEMKPISIPQAEATKVDADNYIIVVDTDSVGKGRLKCKVTARVPDGDLPNNYRKEVAIVDTGLDII